MSLPSLPSLFMPLPVSPPTTSHDLWSQDNKTSDQVLAEKRKRNAGASARFRDRRKQKEKELMDRCAQLEQRTLMLEHALRWFDQEHPLLMSDYTLMDRVGQLEHMMHRLKDEKETDFEKASQLEKENKYLRSLLAPSTGNKRRQS